AVLHDAHARNRRLLVHGRAASALTKSRRRIAFPNLGARPSSASNSCCQNRKLRPAKWDPKVPSAPRRRGESNKERRLLRRIQSRLALSGHPEDSADLSAFGGKADTGQSSHSWPGCQQRAHLTAPPVMPLMKRSRKRLYAIATGTLAISA